MRAHIEALLDWDPEKVELDTWLLLGMELEEIDYFLFALSQPKIKFISLMPSISSDMEYSFYKLIYEYIENIIINDDRLIRLLLPVRPDVNTGEIQNFELICNFLKNAKGKWLIEMDFLLDGKGVDWTLLKNKIKKDCHVIFNSLNNNKNLKLIKTKTFLPSFLEPINYPKFSACNEEFEIDSALADAEELQSLIQLLQNVKAHTLFVSVDPKEGRAAASSLGELFIAISQNKYVEKFTFKSHTGIKFCKFPFSNTSKLNELDISNNTITNISHLNRALKDGGALSQVKKLDLSGTCLFEEAIETILDDTNIQSVILKNNWAICGNLFNFLALNPILEIVDLRGCEYENNLFVDQFIFMLEVNRCLKYIYLDPYVPLYKLDKSLLKSEKTIKEKILLAYKNNPVLKIVMNKECVELEEITKNKIRFERPEQIWAAKQGLFKLSHEKINFFDKHIENKILRMADFPVTHPQSSLLNLIRSYKKNIPSLTALNKITNLFSQQKDEYSLISQIEKALVEDRYTDCIHLSSDVYNNSHYSTSFRSLSRTVAGTLKDWTSDIELKTYQIV